MKIRNAIDEVYRDRSKLTRDVGGTAGTSEFADAIIQAMESQSANAAGEAPADGIVIIRDAARRGLVN